MKSVIDVISPLIKHQFPEVYQDTGPEFILFVEAYFQWLESNFQKLQLTSTTNFNVADTITQGTTTGTIFYVDSQTVLVKVNGFTQFNCNVLCNDFTPVTSSSGGTAYVKYQWRVNPIYNARKLPNIRDIDTTLDSFVVHFKEKYLKNIDFDVATNKKMLVKNSLDLYRAKGTSRAVDLFFRLMYGAESKVEYPGEKMFRLSDGEWFQPVYLEISHSQYTVNLVGKEITGAISGAKAFVEKYIKRIINGGFVYILQLSAVRGTFVRDEVLKAGTLVRGAPAVLGSLNDTTIVKGGSGFAVGDIVKFNSSKGEGALARVASIGASSGIIEFDIIEGGYGYTVNGITGLSAAEQAQRSQTVVSEKTITVTSVATSNVEYFKLFEGVTQPRAEIVYDHATNNTLFDVGSTIRVSNATHNTAFGVILTNSANTSNSSLGTLLIGITDNGTVTAGDDVYLVANPSITANIGSVNTAVSATANVMGWSNSATLTLTSVSNAAAITFGDVLYQVSGFDETANATITATTITGVSGNVEIANLNGAFVSTLPVLVRNKPTVNASLESVKTTVGVYNISNTFSTDYNLPIFFDQTGSSANVYNISDGADAAFKIGALDNSEVVYLNTDLISGNNTSNVPYLNVSLNAASYGFSKNASSNASSVLFNALTFDNFTIGTISALNNINPGIDYNIDPFTLAYQPLIVGLDKKDYVFTVANATGSFSIGETIQQAAYDTLGYTLYANGAALSIGEFVYQGEWGGYVSSVNATAISIVNATANLFANSTVSGNLFSGSNIAYEQAISSVVQANATYTARGIVKDVIDNTVYVKRIQFDNLFLVGNTITGDTTGATAIISTISEDSSSKPIGHNADIAGLAAAGTGVVKQLEITDSGLGYKNNQELVFVSEDGTRTGTVLAIVNGSGKSKGYYRRGGSFISSDYKIQDGYYYQEYSYEIFSRVPLDKYSDMFKKVVHVAGTQLFGSVLVESYKPATVNVIESSVTVTP